MGYKNMWSLPTSQSISNRYITTETVEVDANINVLGVKSEVRSNGNIAW